MSESFDVESLIVEMHTSKAGIGSEFGFSKRGGYRFRSKNSPRKADLNNAVFTANGRAALALAAKHLIQTTDLGRDTVLMPAYLCPTMIQSFAAFGLKIGFYPINADLIIDPAVVCEHINERTLAVVSMNYFGFPQTANLTGLLAEKNFDLTVIDDRTHMLLSDLYSRKKVSDTAISVYSARKWGPFPDLGIIVWPHQNGPMPGKGYDWLFGFWRILDVLLRAVFFAWPTEVLRRLSLRAYHRAELILDQRIKIRQPSPFSLLLWRFWDWLDACHRRRANYQYLLDNWTSNEKVIPVFDTLPEDVCPLGFPVMTLERDALRQHLIGRRVFAPIHWPRPSELVPGEFPEADAFISQELTIPIDQRYGAEHMDHILEGVASFV